MTNKVLCIAVHPDDETIGIGGTLLKHKANGDEVYWAVVTSWNKDNKLGKSDSEIRERENVIKRVSEAYSFDDVFLLRYPVIELYKVDTLNLIKDIGDVIDKVHPNIVYIVNKTDVHSDHRIVFDAAYSCTKSFRKPFINAIYMYETLSETEFAPSLVADSFVPNVYVDISDFLSKKIEILKLYDVELMEEPYSRSISAFEALARYRGSRAGVMYSESLSLLYEKK
jgi:N-acetylglucosamine malate deacetylase 1